MGLRDTLALRRFRPHTPYIANAWEHVLEAFELMSWYPHLVEGLHFGFYIGVPEITHTFTPENISKIKSLLNSLNSLIS